jgi:hypothetical protein
MSTPTSDSNEVTGLTKRWQAAFDALPDDFRALAPAFERDVLPLLAGKEAARQKALRRGNQFGLAGLGIAAAGGGAALLFNEVFLGFLGVGGGIASAVIGYSGLGGIGAKTKGMITQQVAKQFGLDFQVQPEDTSLIFEMKKLRLVPYWDRASFEDRIIGERRGVPFEFFEAHLEDERTETDSKGNTSTRWVTVFRGQVIRMKAPREFYGVTLIARDAGWFNALGEAFSDLKRARLEDPDFEKAFQVYTTDQVEARYLLTPDVMARIMALETTFKGRSLQACFNNGQLFLSVQEKNLFEMKDIMKTAIDDPTRLAQTVQDFGLVFRLIDDLAVPRGAAAAVQDA